MRDNGIIGNQSSWPVAKSNGGELVKIEVRPGVYVKMHREDAEAQGLLKAKTDSENKMKEPAANKKRRGRPRKAE
jgi:hypothetical protein